MTGIDMDEVVFRYILERSYIEERIDEFEEDYGISVDKATRERIVRSIRRVLNGRGFMEVNKIVEKHISEEIEKEI